MTPIYWFVSPGLMLPLIFQPLSAAEAREAKRVLVLYSEDTANSGQDGVGTGSVPQFTPIQ